MPGELLKIQRDIGVVEGKVEGLSARVDNIDEKIDQLGEKVDDIALTLKARDAMIAGGKWVLIALVTAAATAGAALDWITRWLSTPQH